MLARGRKTTSIIDSGNAATTYDQVTDDVLPVRNPIGYSEAAFVQSALFTRANLREASLVENHISTLLAHLDTNVDNQTLFLADRLTILRLMLKPAQRLPTRPRCARSLRARNAAVEVMRMW